jgi:hypothetical protein
VVHSDRPKHTYLNPKFLRLTSESFKDFFGSDIKSCNDNLKKTGVVHSDRMKYVHLKKGNRCLFF